MAGRKLRVVLARKIMMKKMKQLAAVWKDDSGLFASDAIPQVNLPRKPLASKANKRAGAGAKGVRGRVAGAKGVPNRFAALEMFQPKTLPQFEDVDDAKNAIEAAVKDDFSLFAAIETPSVKLPSTIEEEVDLNNMFKYLPVDCIEPTMTKHEKEVDKITKAIAVNAKNTFVNLPGEVINLIMKHLFVQGDCYEIKWRFGKTFQTHWKYNCKREWLDNRTNHGLEQCFYDLNLPCWDYWKGDYRWSGEFTDKFLTPILNDQHAIERRKAFHPQFRRHFNPQLRYVSGVTAFLMVCHRFHDVGVSTFYGSTTFSFGSVRLFSKFLSNLLPMTLPWLHKLYLNHEVYGHPMFTAMLGVRDGDIRTWENTCKVAATSLTGLKSVHLLVRLKEFPPDLSLQAPWIKSILHFRETRLHQFELALRSGPVATDLNDADLRACCRMVRRAVLPHKFIDKFDFSNYHIVDDVMTLPDPQAFVAKYGAGRHEAERRDNVGL